MKDHSCLLMKGRPVESSELSELMTDEEYRELLEEIADCEKVQSWNPGATRSGWVSELRRVKDAYDAKDLEVLKEAVPAAEKVQEDLAREVVNGMATNHYEVAESIVKKLEDVITELNLSRTMAEVINLARKCNVTIDDANHGQRDGYYIDNQVALAYASKRSIHGESESVYASLE